jgi:hypothetical protein
MAVSGSLLVEFLFRLTFGIAVAMGLTPSAQVTSGFYRVHLWVLLGLQTLAVLVLYSSLPGATADAAKDYWQFGAAMGAAVVSYLGATIWMYERRLAGKIAVWLVAALALAGCLLPLLESTRPLAFQAADRVTGGLLLGLVTAAMLLGHWYLNTPTMKLAPLKRLILLLAAAVLVRAIVSGSGLWLELGHHAFREMSEMHTWVVFLVLRWLAGIAGVLGLAWLTWQTLKIPNTQSATGILYAAVVLALIGELTSQLLSAGAWYPV